MTGPEHYRAAEVLLGKASDKHNRETPYEPVLLARAQVHATLALAAATALGESGEMPLEDLHLWKDVASEEPVEGGDRS